MALTYISIPTDQYTYADINNINADSINPKPKFIDNSSWTLTKNVEFMGFGYQYTGGTTPPSQTPLYAIYLIPSSVSNISSCWLQDGGPNGSSNTHVSTPSLYTNPTNVWHHLESGNLTPMQVYMGGQTTEYSVYMFVWDAVYGDDEEEDWFHQSYSGGVDYYNITVNDNDQWIETTYSYGSGYVYEILVSANSEPNYDGVVVCTGSHSSGSGFSTMTGWSDHLVSATGHDVSNSITFTPSSSGTLYIYFRTDTSTIYPTAGTTGYVQIQQKYKVTLNDNGGSGGSGTQAVQIGLTSNTMSVNVPTRGSYEFLGYYNTVAKTGGTQYIQNTGNGVSSQTITSNITLYARWKNAINWSPSTSVSATYSSSAQDVTIASIAASCASGGTISYTVISITKSGTTQSTTGWSATGTLLHIPSSQATGTYTVVIGATSPASSSNTSNTFISGSLTKTITLTINTGTITLTLKKNGGSGSDENITVTPGAAAGSWSVGTAPTRTGYTFKGYYAQQSNTSPGTRYTDGTGTTIAAAPQTPTNLFAHWTPNISYNPSQTVTAYCTTGNHEASVTDDDIQVNLTSTAGSGPSGTTVYFAENNESWDVTTDGKALIVPEGVSAGTYNLEVSAFINAPTGANYDSTYTDIPITLTLNANVGTWGNPTVSHTTPVQLSNAGETYTMSPTLSQTCTFSNGTTSTNTSGTFSYAVQTSKTGFSLSSNKVTVTNNTSTSARNGFVVRITGTANGKSGTKDVTFNQTAGLKVYGTPTVSAYTYSTSVSAGGATDLQPATLTYSQSWTWNGVSGSGDLITSGGTLAFTNGSGYSWVTNGTNFATTGKINVATRGTTTGSARDFYDTLSVTVTLNGKTSSSKTCTQGRQSANSLTWGNPSLSVSSPTSPYAMAVSGETKEITATATQTGTYTSGSTTSATPTITYAITTAKDGYSISSNSVTVTNNTSTSARNGCVVTVTATGNSKTSTSTITFNQAAGSKVYGTPTVSAYKYSASVSAGGATDLQPSSLTYSQTWTWNGVSGSGGSITSGGTLAFTSSGRPAWLTEGTNFATTGKINVASRGTSTGAARSFYSYLKVTVKLNGKTSSSKTCTQGKQNLNKLTWGSVSLTTVPASGSSYAMAVSGETKSVTYTASQSGSYSSGSTDTYTPLITYTETTAATGYSLSATNNGATNASGSVTVTNNTSTSARNGYVITVTAAGITGTDGTYLAGCNQTTTSTITFNQVAGSKVYGTPSVTVYTYSTSVSAAGASNISPSLTCICPYTWNGVSGSGGTDTITSGITWAFTRATTYSWATAGTDFSTTGKVTIASRGTEIGNARDFYGAFSVTATYSGKTSSSKTATTGKQNANYVTAITPKSSSNTNDPHFSYANIGAGATSASPTLSGGAVYTFTSGETAFDSSSSPSFGGSATYTRTYTLGSVQNGFTAVNSSTGVLTATSYGTTVGNARTSGTVTSVLTVTYTHASTYSAGGTVTSSTKTSTGTCTQGANALVSISLTVGATSIVYGNSTTGTVTATYTSGATQEVTSGSTFTTNPTGILQIS